MKTRQYSELIGFETFEDRFEYLKIGGDVGAATFGFDRHVNQRFYTSPEWKSVRRHVILRDNGCDLGVHGYDIPFDLLIHHMNPLSLEDIVERREWILDPNFLITTTRRTHNAIHFGADNPYPKVVLERMPGDTRLW